MIKFNSTKTYKKALLGGMSVVAFSAMVGGSVLAADVDLDTADDTSNVVNGSGQAATDDIIKDADDGATDFGGVALDADADVTMELINIDEDGTFILTDTEGTSDNTLNLTGSADILTGKTLTVYLGGDKADNSGTGSLKNVTLAIAGDVADDNATTQVRGGNLTVVGAADGGKSHVVTVGGSVLLDTVTLTGGAGGGAADGDGVAATFGDATTDTFDVTGLNITGGASAGNAGGAASAVISGTATIGSGGINVTGGAGTGAGAGGNATVTFNEAVTITGGDVDVTGGTDTTGAGGVAKVVFTKAVTSDSALNLTGGVDANSTAGNAEATFGGDATFSAVVLDDTATGLTSVVLNGSGDQTFTGTINGGAEGEGTVTVNNTGGTVTFKSAIGGTQAVSSITITDATKTVFEGDVTAADLSSGAGDVAITLAAGKTVEFQGNVDLISVAGDADTLQLGDKTSTVEFTGTAAQTFGGDFVTAAAADDIGVINVSNAAGVTVNGSIGAATAGLASATIASGATLTQKALTSAVTFDVVGDIDDGAATAGKGGTLVVAAGDGNAQTADGGAVTLATISGDSYLTALTFQAGAGSTGSGATNGKAGGDVTNVLLEGATKADTLTFAAGNGANGVDEDTGNGGDGGAIADATVTGLVTGDVVLTGGNAGTAGNGGSGAAGGDAGNGGLVAISDFTGGITGNLTLTGGAASAGGNAHATAASAGGAGGDGGSVTVSDISADVTGNVTLTGGAGADAGTKGTGANGGAGGAGGDTSAVVDGNIDGNVVLTAGASGSGAAAAAVVGGDGGDALLSITGNIGGTVAFDDGTAGTDNSGGSGGAAGTAGVSKLTLNGTAATAQTVTGAVTAAADGEGEIVVNQTGVATGTDAVIFSSTVGSSTAALGTLTQTSGDIAIAGNAFIDTITTAASFDIDFDGNVTAETALTLNTGVATFAGDVTAETSFDFAADGTATFDGTAAQTVTGAITATGDNTGTINVENAAGVTFKNAIGVAGTEIKEVAVSASNSATFEGALFVETLDVDGTVTFVNDGHEVDTDLQFADGSTIVLGTGVANGETVITTTTDGTDLTGNTVTVQVQSTLGDTETVTLIDSVGTNAAAATYNVTDTALFTYAVSTADSGNDVVITAAKRTTAEVASQLGASVQVAAALDNANQAVATGDAAALNALNTVLIAGGSAATNAAEQIAVQADVLGAVANATVSVGAQSFGAASNRLASLRTGGQFAGAEGAGIATGDHGKHSAGWIKAFGTVAEQDERNGIAGYEADTAGVAFGMDTEVAPGVRLGGSFSYATTEVEGDGAGNAEVDIDSYQFTVYGDYTTDTYYVEGSIGYATNENESTRTVNFGGINRIASGDYDSDQFMISVSGGMPLHIEGETYITPTAGLSYTNVDADSYTETGAGGLNLQVDPDDVEAAIASLGAKVHTSIKQGAGVLVPSARLGMSYDLAGDEAEATARYTGGGAAFTAEGADVEEFGVNVGLGLAYEDAEWSVGVNYDAEFKSDYDSHSATLEARFKF